MKKLSLFLLLLLSIVKVSACSCVHETLPQNYLDAGIVGIIKILRVYDEDEQQRTYKADVEFEKVYKGAKFTTLQVRGLIGRSSSAACEINIQPNERYMIFLNKSDSSYSISSCTPKSKLENKPTKAENLWLKNMSTIFSYLDNNNFKFIGLQFARCYDITQTNYKSDLSEIKGFKPKQPFAIYKVKVDDSSRIQEINSVLSFGSKDNTIENILKTKMSVSKPISSWIPDQKEFLLFLSYNKENTNDPYDEVISCD